MAFKISFAKILLFRLFKESKSQGKGNQLSDSMMLGG
jgi:hypothetical protein